MKQHIRYVDCGQISPEIYLAIQEYDNVLELTEPILFKFFTDRTLVDFWQGPYWDEKTKEWKLPFSNLSDYFNAPKLSDILMCRPYVKLELIYADMGYYVTSPYITNFSMFYPQIGRVKEDKHKRQQMMVLFHKTIQQILDEKYNLKVKIGKDGLSGNDVYFRHNGNLKKFVGSMYRPGYGSNWNQGVIDMSITYKFDSEIANRIRTHDSKIRIKKFDVEDISNMVGGLWEVNSSIQKNELEMEWVNRVCKSLNFSIRQDILTKEEESKLFERGHRRMTEKEWYLYGNNDGFDIY